MTSGLSGERTFDAADQLRLEQMLQEYAWASFHIWNSATRCLSKGDFRSDGWCILGHLAQNAGWRERVAQSQTYWLPSGVRLGRARRRARQNLTKRCSQPLAGVQSRFPYENTSTASHARSRQRWLILFSLGNYAMRSPLITFLLLLIISSVLSARDAREDKRIEYLLETVESLKGAAFIRNGTEYSAKDAGKHLRMKLAESW